MKILLLGCNGQIGWELQRSLQPLGEVIPCDFNSPGDLQANFCQPDSLAALITRVGPDVIVNAAAYTAVDKAESEPRLARLINATTPGVIANSARQLGALLIHYSTDYVYDGSGKTHWDETAVANPRSVYGATKLEGDELIRSTRCRHIILRTSWVYAARGNNFIKTILKLAAESESLSVIDDQVGSPTGADLLADVSAHLISKLTAGQDATGLYHCVAGGATSWFEYARFIISWARANELPVNVIEDRICPISTSAYQMTVTRPLNSRLSTNKLRATFSIDLPDWRVGVIRMLRETYRK